MDINLKSQSEKAQGWDGVRLTAREFAAAELHEVGSGFATARRSIMFMPGGTHQVNLSADRGSASLVLLVDAQTAPVLNQSLAALHARMAPQKPFIDREHEGKEATAWPLAFRWSETPAPGIYVEVELSSLGRQLIDGKVLRAFSPSFFSDADFGRKGASVRTGEHVTPAKGARGSAENPARIIGLVAPDVGTLTNQPAFKKILPLWAKNQTAAGAVQPFPGRAAGAERPEEGTSAIEMKLTEQELNRLRARKTELDNALPTLRAKDQTEAVNAEAAQAAATELEGINIKLQAHDTAVQNETLQGEIMRRREQDADAAIAAAVKRGAIPPKNETLRAAWRERLIQDPKNLELLTSIPSAPALQPLHQPLIIHGQGGGAQEMRASTGSVLRQLLQYANGDDHKAFANLYAKEINARLKEGDEISLRAADVADGDLGTLAGTMVSTRILEYFHLELDGILNAITTDFSSEASEFNVQTKTRIVITPAVESYVDADTGWVQGTPAKATDVNVTIDRHRGVPIRFGTNTLATTVRRLFDEQAPAAAYALAKDVIDNLYSKILAATFTDPAPLAIPQLQFGRASFGIVGSEFNTDGVPMNNRFALLNSDYHDTLEQDLTMTNLAVQQSSRENIITEGRLPKIKRFQPIEAPNLPTTGNMAAFFGHKSSLLVKSRIPNDYTAVLPGGAAHGLVRTVSLPNGLSAMVVWFADHGKGAAHFRIALMYGTAAGNIAGGKIIKSQ